MDLASVQPKLINFLKKYKYALLVLILGIILMNLPQRHRPETSAPAEETVAPSVPEADLQQQLEGILSRIEGAGAVKVLLTVGEGETIYYQQDQETNDSGENTSSHFVTVITTDPDKKESGLIHKRVPETYRGALVLCQGAQSPTVRLAVIDAVSKVTGLSTDHISVVKMK